MAEDVKQEMNATPGCIPSKWTRNTVADGDWLQKYTIGPLSSRDNFLADKISGAELNIDEEIEARKAGDAYLSANLTRFSAEYFEFKDNVETSAENLSAALQAEIITRGEQDESLYNMIISETATRRDEDNKLQKQIDKLEAATDVIMVYSDYNTFTTESAYLVDHDYLTDADVIKVLYDETSGSEQVYYQWYDPASGHEWSGWSGIGSLEPYYSIADVDRIISDTKTELSSVVSNNYLSAKGAVLTGRNIVITEDQNNPKITIATKDVVDFDKVSATTAYGSSAKFDNISSTSLTALTATGNSAKFTNVSSQNLSSTNISATNLSATNASGTSAIYNNLSSTNLYALTASGNSAKFTNISSTTAEIDTLSSNHITVYDKNDQPDTLNVQISNSGFTAINQNLLPLQMSSYSAIYDCSGISYNTFYIDENNNVVQYRGTVTPNQIYSWDWAANFAAYGHLSAWSVNHSLAKVRYNKMSISAGDGIAIHVYDKTPDVPVSASGYNAIKISADANLLGSAYNGQSAYNYITDTFSTAYWSAYKDNSHKGSGKLSASFSISAGDNLDLSVTNNIIKLDAKPTGLTSISAGGNINANKNYTDKLSLSATSPVKFVTAANNVLGVGVESATLQAGQGITFYKAGTNILGISAEGTKVSAGGNINTPTEYTTNVNLSAGGGVQFVTANNDVLGIKTSTMEYSPYNYSTYSNMTSFKISAVGLQGTQYESVVKVNDSVYGFLLPDPSPSDHLKIPVARHDGVRGYYYLDNVTAAVGNYVSAANSQKITIATAASLPSPLDENVYYLI